MNDKDRRIFLSDGEAKTLLRLATAQVRKDLKQGKSRPGLFRLCEKLSKRCQRLAKSEPV